MKLTLTQLEDRLTPATLPEGFVQVTLIDGLEFPTSMAEAPDGRIFVTEKNGNVRVAENGALLSEPFLSITVDSLGERGLLGLAFDPDFENNGFVYVYHTVPNSLGGPHNQVSRFTADGNLAVPGSRVDIVTLDSLANSSIHNGGAMHFGQDGKLYVATGDAANPLNSQNLSNRHGKILRYNPDGTIPDDNPTSFGGVSGTTTGVNRAIWAIGLRNPFTFAIQPETGTMFINDVGGSRWEEINLGKPGANYGWPLTEGNDITPFQDGQDLSGITFPIYKYATMPGFAAIAGAAFYNSDVKTFPEQYHGGYFFGDFVRGQIFFRDANTGEVSTFLDNSDDAILGLSVLQNGDLAFLNFASVDFWNSGDAGDVLWGDGQSLSTGTIKIIRFIEGDQAPLISQQPLNLRLAAGEAATFTVQVLGTSPISIQWQRLEGEEFVDIPGANGSELRLSNPDMADSGARFRAVVSNPFGEVISRTVELLLIDGRRPVADIVLPLPGQTFSAGDTIRFEFTGFDPDLGDLPDSAFSYRVDYITGAAAPRPFIETQTGRSGEFVIPRITPFLNTNVAYRITLTVVSELGLPTRITRDILPNVSSFKLVSSLPQAPLFLDGTPVPSGTTVEGVVGILRQIGAQEEVVLNGVRWRFVGWDDGGPREREIFTPGERTTFVARYEVVGAVPITTPPGVVGSASGSIVQVQNGEPKVVIRPFGDQFNGTIRYALGDFNGDGIPDIVAAAGPGGGPHVKVINGLDGSEFRSFFAYTPDFFGGVHVQVADVNGDGVPDIITATGEGGGPHIKVFDGQTGETILSFFAFDETFFGGMSLAVGDITGNGVPEIIVGAGPGGGPHVKAFDSRTGEVVTSFFAFDPSFAGGVSVTTVDINGVPHIAVAAGPGGGPRVSIFNGNDATEVRSFFAFEPEFLGGVDLTAGDFNGNGRMQLALAARQGGSGRIRVIDPISEQESLSFLPFGEGFMGGIRVATRSDLLQDNIIVESDGPPGQVRLFSGTDGDLLEELPAV